MDDLMNERIIGYYCPMHGIYKEEPFTCWICNAEATPHIAITKTTNVTSERYANIHIYVNKMREVTQRNAIQLLERGY